MRLIIFFLILSLLVFTIAPQEILAQSEEHVWKRVSQTYPQRIADYLKVEQTQISAIVGYSQIDIEGYTSPEASVQLTSSQGNLGQHHTRANKEGLFRFAGIVLPESPGELWLQATDKQGLTSPPVAIPEPPINLRKIENIVLPPTLAHNNGVFKKDSKSLAYGQATPNSQVEVYFFKIPNISWLKKLFLTSPFAPKNAQAQQDELFPSLKEKFILKTDKGGYFSFQLPSQTSQAFRYYAGSVFANNYSPKSNILSFRVLSLIEAFYQQILVFADKVSASILIIIKDLTFWIFLEIIILILLVKRRRAYSPNP
ncbi:MAG: hypothetical protein PHR64_00700 [Candidatus Shapirobacteria bacterium]|nr:hypothetical protein [Candidatus Shapirobacteria bacterium]MDD5074003.1 hypothetical protein [Candidatus Shapirobacteria bacterium]MDD5481456.1 hypothetical protein [Candidatus Shapirobacteria bacterium]